MVKDTLQFFRPGIDEIIEHVAQEFKVSKESINDAPRGRVKNNIPRWVTMALEQDRSLLKKVERIKSRYDT